MAYRAFDGGRSVQAVPDDYKPAAGEKLFKEAPTEAELGKAFTGFAAKRAADKAREAARLSFEAAAFAGCQIESTGTPKLDGTYSLRPNDLMVLVGIAAQMTLTGALPGGKATFVLWDQEGSPHTFDRKNFTNFYGAMLDYYYAIKLGTKAPQPAVIP